MAFVETPIIGASPTGRLVTPLTTRGPLVIIPRVKWERDPGIADMVDYLDEERFLDLKTDEERWDELTVPELKQIHKVSDSCRDNFTYASRNFFWITNKKRGDLLFKLWESQELIYEHLIRMKARGIAQKIQILKARQLGALDPDTPVLTVGLKWVRLGDLRPGNRVICMDSSGIASIESEIEKCWTVRKEGFGVTLENGIRIMASEDHPLQSPVGWMTVGKLSFGDHVMTVDGWRKIASIEPLGERELVDIQTSTGTFIANGLVTHNCSTLIEGLIAWRTMFFRNVNAIVVSYDPEHAAYLFSIMQHIYDRMPWWLKPMCASREYKDGMIFENPNYEDRRANPGLNSKVKAEGANKRSGVGTGTSISAAHLSEYGLWAQQDAREVIEQDLGPALAEGPDTFAILESTARGTGNYSYDLWNKNVELGENAEWEPIFLPWFFESTRWKPVPPAWKIEPPEKAMRERILMDWLRCGNPDCLQYHERFIKTNDRSGQACMTCQTGVMTPYSLEDKQLRWMQWKRKNSEKDSESLKKLKQEMATTAETAFQTAGYQMFTDQEREFASFNIRPPRVLGFMDKGGRVHGCDPKRIVLNPETNNYYEHCYIDTCTADHEFGDDNGECPLQVWLEPEAGIEYCIGADVAEGLGGDADYSVGVVLRVNRRGGADHVAAVFRSNNIDPVAFAGVLVALGNRYNEALLAIEINRFDTTLTWARFQLQYTNMYRFKHVDSINPLSNKLGWLTTCSSKPRLYQMMKRWLQQRLIHTYSKNFFNELVTYTREDYEGRAVGAEGGAKDDEATACMIALYCAHEGDYDEDAGMQFGPKRALTLEESPWRFSCNSCGLIWPASNTQEERNCPRCESLHIVGNPNFDSTAPKRENPDFDRMTIEEDNPAEPDFAML